MIIDEATATKALEEVDEAAAALERERIAYNKAWDVLNEANAALALAQTKRDRAVVALGDAAGAWRMAVAALATLRNEAWRRMG